MGTDPADVPLAFFAYSPSPFTSRTDPLCLEMSSCPRILKDKSHMLNKGGRAGRDEEGGATGARRAKFVGWLLRLFFVELG